MHSSAPKARGPRTSAQRPEGGEPGLLSHMQRGFQALLDGESYVQQRAQQVGGRPGPSAESLVDKVCSFKAIFPTHTS